MQLYTFLHADLFFLLGKYLQVTVHLILASIKYMSLPKHMVTNIYTCINTM